MSKSTLALLTHDELLSVNQDSLGESVRLAWHDQHQDRSGQAADRVVSAPCDVKDVRLHWTYDETKRLLEHVVTGKCLSVQRSKVRALGSDEDHERLLAVVKDCNENDELQVRKVLSTFYYVYSFIYSFIYSNFPKV